MIRPLTFRLAPLKRTSWTNQRHLNRLCDSVEDHHPLARAERLCCFIDLAQGVLVVLPVIGDPDISRGTDPNVNLQLQSAADVTAWRRDGVTRLYARRAVFGPEATQDLLVSLSITWFDGVSGHHKLPWSPELH